MEVTGAGARVRRGMLKSDESWHGVKSIYKETKGASKARVSIVAGSNVRGKGAGSERVGSIGYTRIVP